MKATCIYRDNGQSVVRELPTMKEPTSHPFEDFTGDRQMADKNIDDWDRYNRHIASLKEYPASWVTKEMDGKDVECRLVEQLFLSYGQGSAWYSAGEINPNNFDEDVLNQAQKRVIAVPVAEESEKQKKLIVEIMSQDEADGLYEQGDGKYYKIGNSRLPVEQGEKVTYSLKKIRNYFGEHDKTPFENWAFVYLDNMIRRGFAPVQPPVSVEEMIKYEVFKSLKADGQNEKYCDNYWSIWWGLMDEAGKTGLINAFSVAAALASGGQGAVDWKEFKTCFTDFYGMGNKTGEELADWVKRFLS